MRGMSSASVDLLYLDPPFNSKGNHAAPIGSKAAGAAFKDTWTLTDLDVAWIKLIEAKHPAPYRVLLAAMTDSGKSCLAYMAVRLIEMHRILKSSGSIYLHCDPTMSPCRRHDSVDATRWPVMALEARSSWWASRPGCGTRSPASLSKQDRQHTRGM